MRTTIFNSENKLLIQARSGKRLLPFWVIVPVAFLIPVLSAFGGILSGMFNVLSQADLAELRHLSRGELLSLVYPQTALEQIVFLASSFGGIFLLLWLWVRWVEKRPFVSLGVVAGGATVKFGRGMLVGGGLFSLAVGIPWAMGFFRLDGLPLLRIGAVLVLLGWLVQGSAEELVFRGWVLPVLSARYGVWVGVPVSAAMFAAMHGLNPHMNVLAVLNLFLFGVFAAVYTLQEERVWGVFGIHAMWNWVQGNVFGLPVSGAPAVGGSLLLLRETGPDWLTGGLFGPEGGVAVLVVLGVALAGLIYFDGYKKTEAHL